VLGTVALLKASADAECRRFVFASSGGAIYGRAARLPTPERTAPKPLAPYGAAKQAAEGYLGMFARTFGMRTLALRYSNVYGPFQDGTGEAGVVAITCERLLSGRAPQIRGDGHQTRDFVFVADVADANVRALRASVTGAINIGTGTATSVRTVVNELAAAAAYSGPIDFDEGRPGEVRDTALDTRRAQTLLGWRAPTPLRDGLSQTFTSFRLRLARHWRAPSEPQPHEVPHRAQDRDEAGAGPHPGDPRVMTHGNLLDAKPAAPALEIQFRVEQGRARQQRRGGVQDLAPHQLEAAVDVFDRNAVERAHQDVEDAGNDQAVAWVGAPPPPSRGQVRGGHERGQQGQIGGIELAVAVHEGDVAHTGGSKPVGDRHAVPALALVRDDPQPRMSGTHRRAGQRHRVIGAAVVDEDDLPVRRQPVESGNARTDHLRHIGRLVVRRNDEA